MAYSIHLRRDSGNHISDAEWKEAVRAHPLLRLQQNEALSVINPSTGAEIQSASNLGDAEIWLDDSQTWVHAIRWRTGCATLKAPRDFDEPDSFLRVLLRELAENLSAQVIGDEGEAYV